MKSSLGQRRRGLSIDEFPTGGSLSGGSLSGRFPFMRSILRLASPGMAWALPWAVTSMLSIGGCADAASTGSGVDSKTADTSSSHGDGGSGADAASAADGVTLLEGLISDDVPRLELLLAVRAGSAAAAKGTWPSTEKAVWPAYSLHKVPTLLVILNTKSMPRRAYLLGAQQPPKDGVAFELNGATLYRYDAGMAAMGPGETVIPDQEVAGVSSMIVTWSALRDTDDLAWVEQLGEGYMTRLRELETVWNPVQACGQSLYPRFEQAIALVLLECAILSDALDAKTPEDAETLLQEWGAVRVAAIEVTNFVGLRARHYDNLFGSIQFVGGRLAVASGQRTADQWKAKLQFNLAQPYAVPVAKFDDLMLDSGDISAAAIEIATRAGWNVEPAFRAGDNVHTVVLSRLAKPAADTVAKVKKRYDWAGYVARAKAVIVLPIDNNP